jgi:hypothetical protein
VPQVQSELILRLLVLSCPWTLPKNYHACHLGGGGFAQNQINSNHQKYIQYIYQINFNGNFGGFDYQSCRKLRLSCRVPLCFTLPRPLQCSN